jgi:hypothetical protein
MLRRILAVALTCAVATPVSAGDLATSAAREVEKLAAEQSGSAAKSGKNELLWPGVGILAGGLVLALYGFSHTTGATVNIGTNSSGTSSSITAKEEHATGVGIAGLAAAGVGGFLIWKGSQDAKRPSIQIGPRFLRIQKKLVF